MNDYVVPFRLYSGKRRVEVRVHFNDRKAYFVDQELVEGETFKVRGLGEEIGPYPTPELAEAAAVSRPWFSGSELQNE